MQSAVQRYRNNQIIQPVGTGTSSASYAAAAGLRQQPDPGGPDRRPGADAEIALGRNVTCASAAPPTPIARASWFSPTTPRSRNRRVRRLAPATRSTSWWSPAGWPKPATRSTPTGATVVVVDLDAGRADEMEALARLMARLGAWPPVVAVTQKFDAEVARTFMQMRVADFLVKPVAAVDLVRACARVAKSPAAGADRPKRKSIRSCRRSAAPASPRWRCRPR